MTCVQNRVPLTSAEVTPVTPMGSLTPKPQRRGRMGWGGMTGKGGGAAVGERRL